jgi:hypothetical protein
MVAPYTKLAKNATNDISILEFHNITRHYVKDTGFTYFTTPYRNLPENVLSLMKSITLSVRLESSAL